MSFSRFKSRLLDESHGNCHFPHVQIGDISSCIIHDCIFQSDFFHKGPKNCEESPQSEVTTLRFRGEVLHSLNPWLMALMNIASPGSAGILGDWNLRLRFLKFQKICSQNGEEWPWYFDQKFCKLKSCFDIYTFGLKSWRLCHTLSWKTPPLYCIQ